MKALTPIGNITETRYKWPERRKSRLQLLGETSASDGDVVAINDEKGLHRIQNDSDSEKAISLHFYYPPIQNCLITGEIHVDFNIKGSL